MATYTIQIWNQSNFSKSYAAFMEQPSVVAGGGNPEIYTNAWATFESVTNGGFDTITYDDVTFAYWGTAPQDPAGHSHIVTGGVAEVNTATRDKVDFSGSGDRGFGPTTPGIAMAGSYVIATNADFTAANNYVFGLARPSGTPMPSPVATFKAMPNDTFNITPVEKFYVTDGQYTPGAVIDITETSTKAAQIDFTGKPQTTATVIQAADGSFSVTYS
jgi:hypothetical protein